MYVVHIINHIIYQMNDLKSQFYLYLETDGVYL